MSTSFDQFISVLGALDLLPHLFTLGTLFVGVCLGWIFRREASLRKEKLSASKNPEPTKSEPTPPSANSEAQQTAAVASYEKQLASLNGELSAAKTFKNEQSSEMERLKSRLTALRTELGNRDRALDDLMSGVGGDGADSTDAAHQVTHQLSESLSNESNRCEIQSGEMKRLAVKLTAQNEAISKESEAMHELRERVEKTGKASESVKRLEAVEKELHTLLQSGEGAVERLEEAKDRLDIRGRSLEMARDAGLAERDEDDPAVTLAAMREALDEMEPGVNQLVSETLGRVEYVVKDSPAKFTKTLQKLSSHDSEEKEGEVGVSMLISQACRRLTGVRGTLEGTELALENARREFGTPLRSRTKWLKVVDQQVKELNKPAPEVSEENPEEPSNIVGFQNDPPEAEKSLESLPEFDPQSELVETLEADLIAARGEIERLKESLEHAQSESGAAEEAPEGDEPEAPAVPTPGRNIPLIRRMLNLSSGGDTAAIEPMALAGSALAGFGAASLPPQSIFEARKALHSLKLAGKNDRPDTNGHDHEETENEFSEAAPESLLSLVKEEPTPVDDPSEDFAGFPMPSGGARSRIDEMAETIEDQRRQIESLKKELNDARLTPTAGPAEVATEAPSDPSGPIYHFAPDGGPIEGHLVHSGAAERLVFRSRDPRYWNTDAQDQRGNFALSLNADTVPATMSYLRITRSDTGESIVLPMTRDELLSEQNLTRSGDSGACGWSGKGEFYFGSGHLGIFDEGLPREVETRFGAGGWGFGHANQIASEQALGWAGKPIADPEAKIEIRLGEQPVAADADGETTAAVVTAPSLSPFSGQDTDAIILYRSNDPTLWNTTHYSAANCRSLALYDLDATISWVRIRRLDTGESVLLPATNEILLDDGSGQRSSIGFNGSGESFYGATHFGIYDEALPQNVETRFSYGGWGYGHDHSIDETQAIGWAGEAIPADTVIEIAVFREMPPVGPNDQVLALERG